MAMADRDERIFIADKEAHAVRRVDPDGRIITVAGTGEAGDDGDLPGPASLRRLSDPNGLYVLDGDGAYGVFILDYGNGKVRKLARDGTLTTFITVPGGIVSGRGLWVAPDEASAFIASSTSLSRSAGMAAARCIRMRAWSSDSASPCCAVSFSIIWMSIGRSRSR